MQYNSLLPISNTFFLEDTHTLAKNILNCVLFVKNKDDILGGRVVESEVYMAHDPCSHSFHGVTPRNKAMFEKSGTVYVYISYGIHYCLNIVMGEEGVGDAVLIRALEPILGVEGMKKNRGQDDIKRLCLGPGCLTQAMGVTLEHNNHICMPYRVGQPIHELQEGCLYIGMCNDAYLSDHDYDIMVGPRIGISKSVDWDCRYFLRNNRYVSSHKRGKVLREK